jgi:hypothetical protein
MIPTALLALLLSLGGALGLGHLPDGASVLGNVDKAGGHFDPNGATADAGGSYDPNGATTDAGNKLDPNG